MNKWNNPLFLIVVAIPVVLLLALGLTVYNWLQVNGSHLWQNISPWLIGAGALLIAAGLTWAGWRVYLRYLDTQIRREALFTRRHHNQIANESYLLLQSAHTNMDNIDIKYSPDGAIDSLKVIRANTNTQVNNAIIVQLQAQMEELKQATLQIAAPLQGQGEHIPEIIQYRDVEYRVPHDRSLLGVYPDTGELEIVLPDVYKTAWFVGASSSGKTNTVYGKVADAVRWGAGVIICDIHGNGNKEDSLTNQLRDFHQHLLMPVASSREQIKQAIIKYMREFMSRREGGQPWTKKWLIVIDEVNALAKMPVTITEAEKKMLFEEFGIKIKDDVIPMEVLIKALVELCGYEGRGFGMFGYFISQKAAHLAWLRNAVTTVFAHRMVMDSEAILVANGDRKMAELVKNFKRGRTLVYGVDIQDPIILQQPLYQKNTEPLMVDSDVYHRPTVELSNIVPSNQTTMLLERSPERTWEAGGTTTQESGTTTSFELKKLLSEIGKMKQSGMSNAEILKQYELHSSGRNNTNLGSLVEIIDEAGSALL
ncbi:hypothetical protein ccbrp13_56560 [Ktedonobacteria bacterium brp13]|nr:hypothetical protein ccbrp13_56560 [Ktedonobacteria bacterium brp13]